MTIIIALIIRLIKTSSQTLKDFISGGYNVLANGYRARVNLAEACYLATAGLKIGRQQDHR